MSPELFAAIDTRIYAFHMPVFFALAGQFFLPALSRNSPGVFIQSRLKRLLWPIVLWTYLFLGLKLLAGARSNTPVRLEDLLILPFPGTLHLWFLWALMIMSLAFLPLKFVSASGRAHSWALAVAGLLVLAGYYWQPNATLHHWFGEALEFAPYMFLGIVVAQYGLLSNVSSSARWGALAVFLGGIAFWPMIAATESHLPAKLILTLSFLTLCTAAQTAPGSLFVRTLQFLGMASMAIYLMHTIFSAALRSLLLALDITDLSTHLLLGTLIGIVASLIGFWIAQRLRISKLLGF